MSDKIKIKFLPADEYSESLVLSSESCKSILYLTLQSSKTWDKVIAYLTDKWPAVQQLAARASFEYLNIYGMTVTILPSYYPMKIKDTLTMGLHPEILKHAASDQTRKSSAPLQITVDPNAIPIIEILYRFAPTESAKQEVMEKKGPISMTKANIISNRIQQQQSHLTGRHIGQCDNQSKANVGATDCQTFVSDESLLGALLCVPNLDGNVTNTKDLQNVEHKDISLFDWICNGNFDSSKLPIPTHEASNLLACADMLPSCALFSNLEEIPPNPNAAAAAQVAGQLLLDSKDIASTAQQLLMAEVEVVPLKLNNPLPVTSEGLKLALPIMNHNSRSNNNVNNSSNLSASNSKCSVSNNSMGGGSNTFRIFEFIERANDAAGQMSPRSTPVPAPAPIPSTAALLHQREQPVQSQPVAAISTMKSLDLPNAKAGEKSKHEAKAYLPAKKPGTSTTLRAIASQVKIQKKRKLSTTVSSHNNHGCEADADDEPSSASTSSEVSAVTAGDMINSTICDATSEESHTNNGCYVLENNHHMQLQSPSKENVLNHPSSPIPTVVSSLSPAAGVVLTVHPSQTHLRTNSSQTISSPIKKRPKTGKRRITPTFVASLSQRSLFMPTASAGSR